MAFACACCVEKQSCLCFCDLVDRNVNRLNIPIFSTPFNNCQHPSTTTTTPTLSILVYYHYQIFYTRDPPTFPPFQQQLGVRMCFRCEEESVNCVKLIIGVVVVAKKKQKTKHQMCVFELGIRILATTKDSKPLMMS